MPNRYVVSPTSSYVNIVTVGNVEMVSISEFEIVTWSISNHAESHSAIRCVRHRVAEFCQPRELLCLVCEVKHLSEAVDENKF